MGFFSVTISKNNDSMKTMQRLEQSYSQDSQTKSNESIIMKVRDNQYLIIDNRNVRIIVMSFHTYCQHTTVSCRTIVTKINNDASDDNQEYMRVRP